MLKRFAPIAEVRRGDFHQMKLSFELCSAFFSTSEIIAVRNHRAVPIQARCSNVQMIAVRRRPPKILVSLRAILPSVADRSPMDCRPLSSVLGTSGSFGTKLVGIYCRSWLQSRMAVNTATARHHPPDADLALQEFAQVCSVAERRPRYNGGSKCLRPSSLSCSSGACQWRTRPNLLRIRPTLGMVASCHLFWNDCRACRVD
jgi:hypothetical protein